VGASSLQQFNQVAPQGTVVVGFHSHHLCVSLVTGRGFQAPV